VALAIGALLIQAGLIKELGGQLGLGVAVVDDEPG
jgi:hypothetical protein